jgi:hypothetical protein
MIINYNSPLNNSRNPNEVLRKSISSKKVSGEPSKAGVSASPSKKELMMRPSVLDLKMKKQQIAANFLVSDDGGDGPESPQKEFKRASLKFE